jgi:thymidylate synthase
MSYADKIFVENCKDILNNGFWDTDYEVRPKWSDGESAHTIKKFAMVNRYDLSKEFPVITLRKTGFKAAVDEMLWIWQKKSNNVHDLNSHIWDSWRTKAEASARHKATRWVFYTNTPRLNLTGRQGNFDLKNNPVSRRICQHYVHQDLHG